MAETRFKDREPVIRKHDVLAEDVAGEFVVYDNATKKAYHLNPSLSWIWQNCEDKKTVKELSAAMATEFQLGAPEAKKVVLDGLRQLDACGLLEGAMPSADIGGNGAPKSQAMPAAVIAEASISRRAMVRGTAFAWPALAVVSVPVPEAARSRVPPGKPAGKPPQTPPGLAR